MKDRVSRIAPPPPAGEADGDPAARGAPLYLRVSQVLRREIVEGIHPIGSLLPTEDVLRERFEVSRFTIREAIRRLREDGLVASRQGAGTMVLPVSWGGNRGLHSTSIDDLVTFTTDTRFDIDSIGLTALEPAFADRLGVPHGDEWFAARGTRVTIAGNEPTCWVEYYINREYAAVGRLLPGRHGAVFALIEDMFAVSMMEVKQEITATLITPTLAERLDEPEGAPALEVCRVYRVEEDKIAQVTVNVHPASRFSHMMTMKRSKT